jgi:broad specificity phosphatase PhoE
MTTFLLIRHGETDANGQSIMGWKAGWSLNARGKQQVEKLAEKLEPLPLRAVYTSPLERALETAAAVARRHGLVPCPLDDLGEMRLGAWEGKSFAELDHLEHFKRFNAYRSTVRAPGGELMLETQTRMVARLAALAHQHPGETIAVVSHGDPLRAVVAHHLGIPLDHLLRFEISPASVSILEAAEWSSRILCLNHTGELPL